MEVNWAIILIALGAGGIGGVISPIVITWLNHKHDKYLKFREEKRTAYSKILPKILSSYTDKRELGERNKIEIDKICGELYLLSSEKVYEKVEEFNKSIELEEKEFKNFLRKFSGTKKMLRYPFSTKLWPEISEDIDKLKKEIKQEMRNDLR